jgi:hypothetical protein
MIDQICQPAAHGDPVLRQRLAFVG